MSIFISLQACGIKDYGVEPEEEPTWSIAVDNSEKAIPGGTLNVSVVKDTPFDGYFQEEFSQDKYDAQLMEPSNEKLFLTDENFKIIDGGAANLDLDLEKNIATITLRAGLKWSDGEPVTAEDIIFSYEVVGHPDYTGIRYDNNFMNIVGMPAYKSGKTDTISGIVKKDAHTVQIHYHEMHPGMLQINGGVWSSVLPKHTLKNIPVKDMPQSDAIRKHPVTLGPFYMSKIETGESVHYLPNPYYYKAQPHMKQLVFSRVTSANSVQQLRNKEVDMTLSMSTDMYPAYKNMDGYQILGRPEQAYTYLGFKLGTWDKATSSVKYDPEAKMADKALRQAMGYALDNAAVGQRFYNGLRFLSTSLITPVFGELHDEGLSGYTLNIKKAEQLLDEAGYKDLDGDGLREDKNGEPLTIHFAAISGAETAQLMANYYLQQWKEIGLDVQFTDGQLLDFQTFYDKLENDAPDIDVYQGAWGDMTNPSPTEIYGPNAPFNYTRFASTENTRLLKAIDSVASFDDAKRKQAFDDWQTYAQDEAFAIPTLLRTEVLPVSNRVKDFKWTYGTQQNRWATVSVTSEERK